MRPKSKHNLYCLGLTLLLRVYVGHVHMLLAVNSMHFGSKWLSAANVLSVILCVYVTCVCIGRGLNCCSGYKHLLMVSPQGRQQIKKKICPIQQASH